MWSVYDLEIQGEPRYVGLTMDLRARQHGHACCARTGNADPLYEAIRHARLDFRLREIARFWDRAAAMAFEQARYDELMRGGVRLLNCVRPKRPAGGVTLHVRVKVGSALERFVTEASGSKTRAIHRLADEVEDFNRLLSGEAS